MKNKKIRLKLMSFLLVFVFVFTPFINTDFNTNVYAENKYSLSVEEYKTKSATELAELVKTKKVTPKQLLDIAYKIIEEENPKFNSVITTRKEEVYKEAEELVDDGNKPFFGVPLLVKGIGHNIKDGDDTWAIKAYEGVKFKRDGSYVRDYKKLGFLIVGQTNYPEFALKSITKSGLYGDCGNAWNKNYNSGGSSGGAASAISTGMVSVASGSDAGGSIRIPASWNSVIGFKPSGGLSHHGKDDSTIVHFPLTKTVEDTKVLFDSLKNKRLEDKENEVLSKVKNIKDLKIGYSLKSPMGTEVSEDAKKAVLEAKSFLEKQGFIVEEADSPIDGRKVIEDYTFGTMGIGGILKWKKFEEKLKEKGLTKEDVDPVVWGAYVANNMFPRDLARDKRNEVKNNYKKYTEQIKEFHKKYPIFLTPTNARTAPLNSNNLMIDSDVKKLYDMENVAQKDQLQLLINQWNPMLEYTPFTQIANVTAEPAISLQTYLSKEKLPLGIMLNAEWGMDKVLLDISKLFEDNNMFKVRHTTKWIEKGENGKELKPFVNDADFIKEEKEIINDGLTYEYIESKVDGNLKIHYYMLKAFKIDNNATKKYKTEWVDDSNKALLDLVLDKDIKDKKEISGYKYIKTEKDDNGNVKYIYKKLLTTRWVEKGFETNKFKKTIVDTEFMPKEDKFVVDKMTYELVDTEIVDTVKTYYYSLKAIALTPAEKKITTKWVDEKGNKLKEDIIDNKAKECGTILDYKFVKTEKKYNDKVVIHVFKKVIKYKARYSFVSGTKGKDLPKEIKEMLPKDKTELINGSVVNATQPVNTELLVSDGKWIFKKYDKNEIKIEEKDIVFVGTWVFEKKASKYITCWIDESGETLLAPVEDVNSKDKRDISGYEYIKTEKDNKGNVKHVYRKIVIPENKYIIYWIDESGKTLLDPVEDVNSKDKRDISGYEYIKTEKDNKGNVKHIYRKKDTSNVKIIFNLNGGKINGSSNNVIISCKIGEIIKIIDAPLRDGYEFVYWQGSKYYSNDNYKVTDNHTFTAKWKKINLPLTDKKELPKTGILYSNIIILGILILFVGIISLINSNKYEI